MTEHETMQPTDAGTFNSTIRPMFAVAVARRKWEELQAAGHRMQRLYFEHEDGRSGHIDAWGVVTWTCAKVIDLVKEKKT